MFFLLFVLFVLSLFALGALFFSPEATRANSLVVTDPGDSGPGTLRDAIEQANLNPGPDR